MSVFLQTKLPACLKKFSLAAFFVLFPLFFFAQSLTGLWTGTLSNDSSTVRRDQSFEIALTEYRGKVYGYSRSEFIVNDTLYYIMKRVKGTIEGDVCEVKDDEIISYNFRGKIDKGIKVTSTFRRNHADSTWHLEGTWKTNATKKYYAVTGKVALAEEKDLTASKIFPHLEELNLANKVAFYNERKESTPVLKLVKPEQTLTAGIPVSLDKEIVKSGAVTTAKPDLKRAEVDPGSIEAIAADHIPGIKKQNAGLPKTVTKNIPVEKEEIATVPPVTKQANAVIKKQQDASDMAVTTKTNDQNANTENNQKPSFTKQPPAAVTNNNSKNTTAAIAPEKKEPPVVKDDAVAAVKQNTNAVTEKKEPVAVLPKPDVVKQAAVVEGRKSEFTQEVNFSSDSLVLSLYDNGEIDGDTVTIYMNGQVLLAKQGLKASAIKKTIYLTPGQDEFTLVLFADNLGKYPPNTGLLVIRDGNDIYNLRFSADFEKNAGVVFRRKK